MKSRFFLSIFIFLFFTNSVNAHVSNQWHQYYQPIEDQKAYQQLNAMIEYITKNLGNSSNKISKVQLRLSQPIDQSVRIKKNFQLTEINDLESGMYTIYLNHKPDEYAFWGQLVHEVSHLLDPNIHDAYFEGLSTVVAEKYLKENGYSWNEWNKYFKTGHESFYGQTYFMMHEIWEAVGDQAIRNFHNYTKPISNYTDKRCIDINQWIETLNKEDQIEVKKIIYKYAPQITLALKEQHNSTVMFILPN